MQAKAVLSKLFYAAFFCAFAIVVGKVLLFDSIHAYNPIVLLLCLIPAVGLIVLSHNLLTKRRAAIERHYRAILIGFLSLYGLLILVNGFLLRFTPSFDMDAIYGGAVQWIEDGSFSNYYEYYGYFPNNLGAMTVLHFVFSLAARAGVTDFFAVGIVFNSALLTATAMVTSLTCRKLRGSVAGVMALVLFSLCLPFWFMGAAFYTDSLSVLFPILFYDLYLLFKEQATWRGRLLAAGGMAAALTIGMLIKFTVVIVLVAVVIDALLCIDWKRVCLFAGCCGLLAAASFGAMNAYLYSAHLDKAACEELKTPYLHWVMMGLQNSGQYHPEDYVYTRSYPPEARKQACLSRIEERVQALGPLGLTQLFTDKAAVCFGDGTYALSDFLDDAPEHDIALHQYLLYDGAHHRAYQYLTTGILLAVYVLMLLGAVKCLRKKAGSPALSELAPRLASLGILSFLLLWETSGRYFTNFVPLMLVCAVLSLVGEENNAACFAAKHLRQYGPTKNQSHFSVGNSTIWTLKNVVNWLKFRILPRIH